MIEYISGTIAELAPTYAVLENNGMGYLLNISLVTYGDLTGKEQCRLWVYESIREDAYVLYGFLSREERALFMLLISVSGVGANTARMILSSLSASELQDAIVQENVGILKNVKGIGLKTAQRIVVDLKDKVAKVSTGSATSAAPLADNGVKSEAVAALVMLGFQQGASVKVVEKILKEEPQLAIEKVIKRALQMF